MLVGGVEDGACKGMAPNDNTKYWKTAVPVLAFFSGQVGTGLTVCSQMLHHTGEGWVLFQQDRSQGHRVGAQRKGGVGLQSVNDCR